MSEFGSLPMSVNVTLMRRDLLHVLREILLPWIREAGDKRLVLAGGSLHLPPSVSILEGDALPDAQQPNEGATNFAIHVDVTHWPELRLHSLRSPHLAFVVEGEVDLRLGRASHNASSDAATSAGVSGVTRANAESSSERTAGLPGEVSAHEYSMANGYIALSLPAPSFCFIPPGVPHSDGSCVHWERSHLEAPPSTIMWLHILPVGVLCHTCHSEKGVHVSGASLLVRDPQLVLLTEILQEELRLREAQFDTVARLVLEALLLRLIRGLSSNSLLAMEETPTKMLGGSVESPSRTAVLQRACQYIEMHLHSSLSPSIIAQHAYASPAQLNRYFRHDLGVSVMEHVAMRRIETAKALLRDTDLPVAEVGRLVGYYLPANFTRAFTISTNVSPAAYRKQK